MKPIAWLITASALGAMAGCGLSSRDGGGEAFIDIPLRSAITHVQPMTGIVYWNDSGRNETDAIQLEYSYIGYSDVASAEDAYDWTVVEDILDSAAARGHQAIIRFYYVYPGFETKVPAFIKASPGYVETSGTVEGETTWFPDWSSAALRDFTLDFYARFAARYDHDSRLAFLQTGFGLWAEYHIYEGPFILGETFPSKEFQGAFFESLASEFEDLPWSVSIDAADADVSPVAGSPTLLALRFGLFDDSFLCEEHDAVNALNYAALGAGTRYERSPIGGELSYYSEYDQEHALDAGGPYGTSFEALAARFHVSYMIGNDQPDYQTEARIRAAGMATGYRFRVTAFSASPSLSRVTVENVGIAPLYRDAWIAVNGMRANASLKGLLPGRSLSVEIPSDGAAPVLSIACDHLVAGQEIQFEADLN